MHPTKPDLDTIRADWSSRGFSCDLWIDPPDQIWHDFEHDVEELVMLLEGSAQIDLDGRTVRLQPGDELIIPANTVHTVRNTGDGPARWLHGFPSG